MDSHSSAAPHAHGMDGHGGHHAHGGHSGHNHGHMVADFRKRFWVCLVLTGPVLALSPMIQVTLGGRWAFAGDTAVLAGLASAIYF